MIKKEYLQYLKFPPGLEGDWSDRSETFSKALTMFSETSSNSTIVELGTTRSYVGGGFEGCLSPNDKYWKPDNPETWDWQAGCFTIIAAEFCQKLKDRNIEFHTVDLSAEHIRRAKLMTEHIYEKIQYHVTSSLDFLQNFKNKIDLLYIDTGDCEPRTMELQFLEAQIVVNKSLVADGGLILIDDVFRPNKYRAQFYRNKSELSLPFYLQNGFELVYSNYQTLLRKKINSA